MTSVINRWWDLFQSKNEIFWLTLGIQSDSEMGRSLASLQRQSADRRNRVGRSETSMILLRVSAVGFPETDFGRHAGALFEALQPIRLITPDGIRKVVDVSEPMTERARTSADDFSKKLTARGETRFRLETNSSDLLLVLLLPKIARHLATSSFDSTSEAAGRVRWLTDRFQEIYVAEERN